MDRRRTSALVAAGAIAFVRVQPFKQHGIEILFPQRVTRMAGTVRQEHDPA